MTKNTSEASSQRVVAQHVLNDVPPHEGDKICSFAGKHFFFVEDSILPILPAIVKQDELEDGDDVVHAVPALEVENELEKFMDLHPVPKPMDTTTYAEVDGMYTVPNVFQL